MTIAAPVGPVGVIILRRMLQHGPWFGLLSAFGAAMSDMTFAALAAVSLNQIAPFLREYRGTINLVSAVLILVIAVTLFRSKVELHLPERLKHISWKRLAVVAATTFALNFTSPGAFPSMVALQTAFGLDLLDGSFWRVASICMGVVGGSMLIWVSLAGLFAHFRERVTSGHLRWMNRGMGTLLAGMAMLALITGITEILNG